MNQPESHSKRPYKPRFTASDADREKVKLLCAMGIPQEDICKLIMGPTGVHITAKTLAKHFREELDTASIIANQQVAGALFRMATDPKGGMKAVTAQIFWLKTRARWRETANLEVSGVDGSPFQLVISKTDNEL
ncbi:MAG: hypothetical protein ACYCY2_02240 [Acidithiobacillus ferriphilus]